MKVIVTAGRKRLKKLHRMWSNIWSELINQWINNDNKIEGGNMKEIKKRNQIKYLMINKSERDMTLLQA